jgi:hypothetical protein
MNKNIPKENSALILYTYNYINNWANLGYTIVIARFSRCSHRETIDQPRPGSHGTVVSNMTRTAREKLLGKMCGENPSF